MCQDFDGLVDHYRGASAGTKESLERYAGLMAGVPKTVAARTNRGCAHDR
jgi:hypothetical protein